MNDIAIAIVVSTFIFSTCVAAGVFFGMKYFAKLVSDLAVLKVAERPEDVARIKNALREPEESGLKKFAESPEEVNVDALGTFDKALKNIRLRQ
jgi:hypothetical protein